MFLNFFFLVFIFFLSEIHILIISWSVVVRLYDGSTNGQLMERGSSPSGVTDFLCGT